MVFCNDKKPLWKYKIICHIRGNVLCLKYSYISLVNFYINIFFRSLTTSTPVSKISSLDPTLTSDLSAVTPDLSAVTLNPTDNSPDQQSSEQDKSMARLRFRWAKTLPTKATQVYLKSPFQGVRYVLLYNIKYLVL